MLMKGISIPITSVKGKSRLNAVILIRILSIFISKVSQKFKTLTRSYIFETAIGSLSFSKCIVSLFRALDSYNIRYGEVRGRGGGNFGGGVATPRVRR